MIFGQTGDERVSYIKILIEEPVPQDLQRAFRSRADIKQGVYVYRAVLIDAHRYLVGIVIRACGYMRAIMPIPLV